ncbi:MAG: NTP transferase domain-containing protein [Fusobacterium sp. JB019]|nr:NTP transferase domain-containing protein [Fusobacterium sp. JB019]
MNTAIILVDKMSTKLENITRGDFPKAFMPINRKPLIERTIETLNGVGIKRIILVTGYLKEFFELLDKKYEGIETVANLNYFNTDTMKSFYCAKESIKDEDSVFLLEGDLIFEKNLANHLIDSKNKNEILVNEEEKSIGMDKLSNSLFSQMFEVHESNKDLTYGEVLEKLNSEIAYKKTEDMLWARIETKEDFKEVTETIYSKILENEEKA